MITHTIQYTSITTWHYSKQFVLDGVRALMEMMICWKSLAFCLQTKNKIVYVWLCFSQSASVGRYIACSGCTCHIVIRHTIWQATRQRFVRLMHLHLIRQMSLLHTYRLQEKNKSPILIIKSFFPPFSRCAQTAVCEHNSRNRSFFRIK